MIAVRLLGLGLLVFGCVKPSELSEAGSSPIEPQPAPVAGHSTGELIRISTVLDGDDSARGTEDTVCISGDGSIVAFLGKPRSARHEDERGLYLYDVAANSARRVRPTLYGVTLAPSIFSLSISGDGGTIAFLVDSSEQKLLPELRGDVFLYDWRADVVEPLGLKRRDVPAEAEALSAAFSGDMNLVAVQLDRPFQDLGPLLLDRKKDEVIKLDSGSQCHGFQPAISADGRVVAFLDRTECDEAGGTGLHNLWLYNMGRRKFELAPLEAFADDVSAKCLVQLDSPTLSETGRVLAVAGSASSGITLSGSLLVCDRASEKLVVVSRGVDGRVLAAPGFSPVLSEAASCVAFVTSASNLVANDTNGDPDVFLYDWAQGRMRWLSAFDETTPSNGMSMECDMSEDGTKVVFSSRAWNLGCSDLNGVPDVYLWKR